MSNNAPILIHNILAQFGEDGWARDLFHKALDKTGNILMAERVAQEAHTLKETNDLLLKRAAEISVSQRPQFADGQDQITEEVHRFIMTRHMHYRIGQQAMGRE